MTFAIWAQPNNSGAGRAYRRQLGRLGEKSGLRFSHRTPGGPSAASWRMALPRRLEHPSVLEGALVGIQRGGATIWRGRLQSVTPGDGDWLFDAKGIGALAEDYRAVGTGSGGAYALRTAILNAVARGLPWGSDGTLSDTLAYGLDKVPNGSVSLAQALTTVTELRGYSWAVDARTNRPFLTGGGAGGHTYVLTPARGQDAEARTLDGMVSAVYLGWVDNVDSKRFAFATNDGTRWARIEEWVDASSDGVLTLTEANQAAADLAALRSQASLRTEPFLVRRGQLRSRGSAPVDLATVESGLIFRVSGADRRKLGSGDRWTRDVSVYVNEVEYDADTDTLSLRPADMPPRGLFEALRQARIPGNRGV